MKTSLLRYFGIASVLAIVGCGGEKQAESNVEVYGGSVVQPNLADPRYYATVALTTPSLRAQGKSFCSGTLIRKNVVLTAAHCITDKNGRPPVNEQYMVSFGTNVALSAAAINVTQKIFHPEYRPGLTTSHFPSKAPNDIGILILQSNAPNGFNPVDIGTDRISGNQTLYVAGFGVTQGRSSNDTGTLRQTSISVKSVDNRVKRFTSFTPLRGTCPGDSGGPAFAMNNNRMTVVGVTSMGMILGGSCLLGLNTFTDARLYSDWVRSIVR